MEKRKAIGLIFILACLSASAQSDYDKELSSLYRHSVKTIQPQEAKKLIGNPKVIFLDTRSPEEFNVSHLPKARFLNYDKYTIEDLRKLPKDCKLILYCSVGYRSERVGEKLLKLGFTDVANLYGGIFEWKNDGLLVVNQANYPTDSIHTYNKNWSKWLNKGIKVY